MFSAKYCSPKSHIYIYIFQDGLIYALFRDSALAVVRVFSWVTVLELRETNVILLDDIADIT
jgi:hypothetical protein